MTPAPHQRKHEGGTEYDSEAEKLLDQKNDATLRARIRGIDDEDVLREWQAELAQRGRSDLMAVLNRRQRELRDSEPTTADASTEANHV